MRNISFYSSKPIILVALCHLTFFINGILAQNNSNNGELKFNTPINREFKNNQADSFQIKANTNELIELEVDRYGIDLAISVFSPTKESLISANFPVGFIGKNQLFFIAPKTGDYEIKITSRRPGSFSGKYTINWKNRREAFEIDRKLFVAMKILGDSRKALETTENRFDTATESIENLKKAAQIFEEIGDKSNLANVFFQIGHIIGKEQGNEREAIKNYEKALALWKELSDEKNQSIVLAHLGYELRTVGKHTESLASLENARNLNKKFKDSLDESITLTYLCKLYNDTQSFQKGFESCREALTLGKDSDPANDFFVYLFLSSLYANIGDDENEKKYLDLSLERVLLTKNYLNPINLAMSKSGIGEILLREKKYTEAVPYLIDALKVSESVKRPYYISYYSNQLSIIFTELKDFQKAVEYSEKALRLYHQYYPRHLQAPLRNAAKVYAALGKNEMARQMWEQAIELNQTNGDPYAESESLSELAVFEKNLGNTETAYRHIQQAVNLSELIRSQLFGQNQRSSYLKILRSYYELEINLLNDLYTKDQNLTLLEKSWQNQEKIRARSLIENFLENGYDLKTNLSSDFFQKEQVLLKNLAEQAQQNNKAVKEKNDVLRKETEAKLQTILEEYQLLKEETRKKNPQFSNLNSLKEFSLKDAQSQIDENTAILEFGLGDEQSFAWLITKNSVKFAKLPAKKIINQLSRDFYESLTKIEGNKKAEINKYQTKLNQQILAPFAKEIFALKRLVVIADGSLQFVPFAMLGVSENEPLAKNTEVINLPSFSSLVYLRENKKTRQINETKTLAVFADPVFQANDERLGKKNTNVSQTESVSLSKTLRDFGINSLSRLPFSGIEAREIAKFAPDKTILATGLEASRQKFLNGDFNQYKILHFATHGFLNQKTPELSGLVLSLYNSNGSEQNGFLRVIDLYSLQLKNDLVVLSACQTALGKEMNGEEIVGLTNGFLYAGASSIVSSLWKVDDAATAEFMKRFYRAMLKEKQMPSTALQTAQNELRQIPRFSHPRHWAGFILTGDWQINQSLLP